MKPLAGSHIWVRAEDRLGRAGLGRLHAAAWLGPNSHCILDGVWARERALFRSFLITVTVVTQHKTVELLMCFLVAFTIKKTFSAGGPF